MASIDERAKSNPAELTDPDSIAEQLFRITAGLAILAAGVVTIGSIVNYFVFDEKIIDLNAGLEASLNNWVTVVAAFGGALAAALHALIFPARRRWFFALAAIFGFLSLDDLITLHERVAENIRVEHIETAIFAPVYGAALLIVWALAREAPARAGRFLRLGLILLVAAILVDLGATFTMDLEEEGIAWPQPTRIAVEEGLEVSGWILVSGALTTLVCLALLDTGRSAEVPPRRT